MKVKIIVLILGVIAFAGAWFLFNDDRPVTGNQEVSGEQKMANLEAFTKLYGYIRYFHPSDEAAELDWEKFAVYGAGEVKGAWDTKELKKRLQSLFLPIAPTMSLYLEGETPEKVSVKDGTVVAWQHSGLNTMNDTYSVYQSKRVQATINNGTYKLAEDKVFDQYPKVDKPINKEIAPGIFCSIPVVIYTDGNETIGSTDQTVKQYEALKEKILSVVNASSDEENVRFAGIITTWNVFQHFYPYFHVTDSDWENQLVTYLKKTEDDKTKEEYISTLAELMDKTKDGHASTTFMNFYLNQKRLPFIVDLIGNELVVTVAEEKSPIQAGDIIVEKDGIKANDVIEQLKKEFPGSPQFKNYLATQYFRYEDSAEIQFKRGEEFMMATVEGNQVSMLDEFNRKENFKEIEDRIYYLDLRLVNHQTFIESINKLSQAKGIIFDLRGYPGSPELMMDLISHLAEKPVQGPIARIPQAIYPDREERTFMEERSTIEPKALLLRGKSVFLTYAGAMSQPEYWLGFIKDNQLAEIVGQPTAGADGNIMTFPIPGNITGTFTGLEILNADRSQTHLIGIIPTVPIERTIEGVKKEEDEYIEAALELIRE